MPAIRSSFPAGPRNIGQLASPLASWERPGKLGAITCTAKADGSLAVATPRSVIEIGGPSVKQMRMLLAAIDGKNDVAAICRRMSSELLTSDVVHLLRTLMGHGLVLEPSPKPRHDSRMLIVVDDFLPDPEVRRAEALRAKYLPIDWFYWPGRFSERAPNNVDRLMKRLEALVGTKLVWSRGPIHGHYRCSLRSSARRLGDNVHTDSFRWNAVLCLTRDEHCEGGVSFYRHRATGLYGRDLHSFSRVGGRFGAFLKEHDEIIAKDGRRLSRWEEVSRVDLRFNRLILFQPLYFHAVNRLFGTSLENGRITQGFSCYTPDDPCRYEAWM
jgi:hypothetical protein